MNGCRIKRNKSKNYNETAVAIIAILPDDGPMWPKHVVLKTDVLKVALKTVILSVKVYIILLVCSDYNVKEMFVPSLSRKFQTSSGVYTDKTPSGILFSGISLYILLKIFLDS
jgi:hypothetical protein